MSPMTSYEITVQMVHNTIIHNHATRHALNGLFPSHINRVAGQRSFLNRGCHLWNSLPHTLKAAPTPQCFETNLLKFITGSGSL